MNLILIKQISILSLFFGSIAGFAAIIPFLGTFALVYLICFIAPIVIWLLVKYNCIELSSVKDGIIVGAISGFVSFLGFSVIYIPISVILLRLFKFSANQGIALMLNNANFFILFVVAVFMSVVGATINSFSGFLTFYIIELIKSVKK